MTDTLEGVDISHRQFNIDWPAVANAGTAFAFVKASEGATLADPMFAQHRAAASANGVAVGAYHFFRPKSPVDSQVANFLQAVSSLSPGELPPALDLEVPQDWVGIALADRAVMVSTWLRLVEQALGAPPFIYASPSFVSDMLGSAADLNSHRLWLANYSLAPHIPAPWSDWTFWQYTENGNIAGIPQVVDRNRFNGNLAALRSLLVPRPPITIASVPPHPL
jgi:lysozyme